MKKIALALALLGACLTLGNAQAPALTYDTSAPVNGGKDIQIEFWTWGTLDLFKALGDSYTKIHSQREIHLRRKQLGRLLDQTSPDDPEQEGTSPVQFP